MINSQKPTTIPVEVHVMHRLPNHLLLTYPNGLFRIVSVRKFISLVASQEVRT